MNFGEIFIQCILPILSFLGGGGLMMLITVKSEKKKSRATADQEMVKVDSLNIDNTKEMINLYKETIEHQKLLFKEERDEMQAEIDSLKRKMKELEITYYKKLEDQASEYNKRICKLEAQVKRLAELSKGVCANCEFSEGCRKLESLMNEATAD
jgi:tRNA(Met) C34 N-acetyltransferase TmcA